MESDEAISLVAGIASAVASAASAGVGIYQATQGPPKPPKPPAPGQTPEQIAAQTSALESARLRAGRGATILTGGGGGTSLMPTGQPLKTTLGG